MVGQCGPRKHLEGLGIPRSLVRVGGEQVWVHLADHGPQQFLLITFHLDHGALALARHAASKLLAALQLRD
jgi:hypothetical protein